MTACAEPSKLAGRLRAIATCRASASASMLSDIDSACSTSRAIGAECTVRQRLRAGRGLAEDDGGAAGAEGVGQRRPGVDARAARCAPCDPGLTRAPSTAVAVTGAA